MSIEINHSYHSSEYQHDYTQDMDEKLNSKYANNKHDLLDANKIAMKILDKTNKKQSPESSETAIQASPSQRQSFGQKIGSIVRGVFGSQKKQQEELRRLEAEVKALSTEQTILDSDIQEVSLDTFSTAGSANSSRSSTHYSSTNTTSKNENNLIDQKASLNSKKSLKDDRIGQLRKKGVK